MTFWAKLLVIIVTVLSLLFAGMSAVIFAKREDYRARWDQAVKEHEATKKDLTAKIERLEGDIKAKQADLERKQTELTALNLQLGTVTNELQQRRGDVTQLKATLQKEQDNVSELTLATKKLVDENKTILAENNDLRAKNLALSTDLSNERTRANELAKANAALKTERDQLSADLATARETIKLNEEVFAELGKRNIEALSVIASFNTMPDVKAKVVTVDPENNLVVLNVGRNHQVRKNFEFTIFRDDKFVAKANVFDVQDDLCAARVTTRKLPVQRGDNAWTRLP